MKKFCTWILCFSFLGINISPSFAQTFPEEENTFIDTSSSVIPAEAGIQIEDTLGEAQSSGDPSVLPENAVENPEEDAEALPEEVDDSPFRDPGEEEEKIYEPDVLPSKFDFFKNFTGAYETDLFTGAATYHYPLWIPQGRRGMTPSVFLSYSSNDTQYDSLPGYGWNLPTNAIYRSTRHGSGQLFSRNDFTADINGQTQELLVVNEEAGLYGGRVETNFTKFVFEDNHWRATDTSGTQYIFGLSEEARQADPNDETHVYKWLLERIEDLNGNFITYTYMHDAGQVYPANIRYTGWGEESGVYEVVFTWEERPISTSYERGFKTETRLILQKITVISYEMGMPQDVLSYEFSHQEKNNAVVYLTEISAKSEINTMDALPSLRMEYYNSTDETLYKKNTLLKKITFPFGGEQEFYYRPSTTYRTPEGEALNSLPFTVHTLYESHLYPSGEEGEPIITHYEYEGGHYFFDQLDAFKKEYAGFHEVTVTDPVGNIRKVYFHQSENAPDNEESAQNGEFEDHISKKGRIYREEQYDNEENLYQKTIRRWDKQVLADNDPDVNRFFSFLLQEVTTLYDGDEDGKSVAKFYAYDNYGNVIQELDFGEVELMDERGNFDDMGEDRLEIQRQYALNADDYLVSFLNKELVRDFNLQIIAEQNHFYDHLPLGQVEVGNETLLEQRIDAENFIFTQKNYNQYGLPTEIINPRGHQTEILYGAHSLYPQIVINSAGHVTQYLFTGLNFIFGIPQEVIDPNNARKVTLLDGLGRIKGTKISDPSGNGELITTTKHTYDFFSRPVRIGQSVLLHQNAWENGEEQEGQEIVVNQWTYLDGLGREIQKKISSEMPNEFIVTGKIYDERGNTEREFLPMFDLGELYEPFAQNAPATVYTYDTLNRPLTITTPVGTTQIQYDQWEHSITDPNENQKDFVFDARENLIAVREYEGLQMFMTHYTYNSLNQLIRIRDAKQNTKNFTYDLRGLKLSEEDFHAFDDPTFGIWTYAYDQNGNLISRITPNEDTITFAYDSLDRPTEENWQGGEGVEIQYTYDQGLFGIGRLSEVTFTDGAKTFTYDQLGRVREQVITIDEENFSLAFTYDIQGNPLSITSPNDITILNRYNAGGTLEMVQRDMGEDDPETIITNLKYAPTGAVEITEFANGIVTQNTYSIDQLYRLTNKRTTRINDGTQFQNIFYEYDPVGNILRIEDQSDTDVAKIAEYTYDDLYRLTEAEITQTANEDDYTRTYSYDILGNILTHSAHENLYEYDGLNSAQAPLTNASPHAVTAIGAREFTYDNNGNLLQDALPNNTWTHEWDYKDRLIHSLNEGEPLNPNDDQEVQYLYDEQKQRIVKNNLTDEEITLYVDKYFDREGDREKVYIYAGNTKIASIETENDEETLIYHHEDHLTGSNVDTDSEGEGIQLIDYFPYGDTRIDEHDENYENDYEFTGKERDDETGLLYYEARYYNSGIGRFIGRDPWEGDLKDPQSLNKYSYVQNNPLKYVDPEGEKVILVGRSIGRDSWGSGVLGVGTHVFLFIEPDNSKDFEGGEYSKPFTLGGYNENKKLSLKKDDPSDRDLRKLKFSKTIEPPRGVSDTEFIKGIVKEFEKLKGEDIEFKWSGRNMWTDGGNCQNTATTLLHGGGKSLEELRSEHSTFYFNPLKSRGLSSGWATLLKQSLREKETKDQYSENQKRHEEKQDGKTEKN